MLKLLALLLIAEPVVPVPPIVPNPPAYETQKAAPPSRSPLRFTLEMDRCPNVTLAFEGVLSTHLTLLEAWARFEIEDQEFVEQYMRLAGNDPQSGILAMRFVTACNAKAKPS